MRPQDSFAFAALLRAADDEFGKSNATVELQFACALIRVQVWAPSDMPPHVSHGGDAVLDCPTSAALLRSAGTQV